VSPRRSPGKEYKDAAHYIGGQQRLENDEAPCSISLIRSLGSLTAKKRQIRRRHFGTTFRRFMTFRRVVTTLFLVASTTFLTGQENLSSMYHCKSFSCNSNGTRTIQISTGVEDPRLVRWKDGVYATFFSFDNVSEKAKLFGDA
jgi:hypothetical protein